MGTPNSKTRRQSLIPGETPGSDEGPPASQIPVGSRRGRRTKRDKPMSPSVPVGSATVVTQDVQTSISDSSDDTDSTWLPGTSNTVDLMSNVSRSVPQDQTSVDLTVEAPPL
jgi:hypothetical protein